MASGTAQSMSERGCKAPEMRIAASSTKVPTEGLVGSHERSLTTATTTDTWSHFVPSVGLRKSQWSRINVLPAEKGRSSRSCENGLLSQDSRDRQLVLFLVLELDVYRVSPMYDDVLTSNQE
jgi:hypothetical protein